MGQSIGLVLKFSHHDGDCLGKSEIHNFIQEKSMPEVIASTSGNYSALIGSMVRPYYFRADGGAFVDTLLGPDLSKAFQDGSFQTAIVAHKVELAIIYPQRQDYKARRPLTIGECYVNELFQDELSLTTKE